MHVLLTRNLEDSKDQIQTLKSNGFKVSNLPLLKISKVCSAKSVYPLQRLIYNLTKKYLVKHNLSSPINKLLKIPFDKDISTAEWGKLCDRINFSEEFKNFSIFGVFF